MATVEPELRAAARRRKPLTRKIGMIRFLLFILAVSLLGCSCSRNSAFDQLKARAKQGDAEAQFQLGAYYHDGFGLPPDYQTAAFWFGKAADQGHAGAEYALGKMQMNAEGMLPDEAQAAHWIRKAADQGYAPAQDELALMYADGNGVMQDRQEAIRWATKAAEQGFVDAQFHLGSLLSSNAPSGGPSDRVAAGVWLSLAASQGHQESEELFDSLKPQLTPAQIEEINRRVQAWKRQHPAPGEETLKR